MTMHAITTRILRDDASLAALEARWWDLWRRIPRATPFQTPAWLLAWWRHFAPGALFTLAAEREDRLVGLAPFYLEEGALGRRLLPLGMSVSDYHDVLLDPSCAREAGAALRDAAFAAPEPWEHWDFEQLMPDAAALSLPWTDRARIEQALQSACPVLELTGPSVEACLPKTKRRKLNLARNRMARHGAVRIERASAATLAGALDQLFRLHGQRWESQGESGVLAEDRIRRLHRDAAAGLEAAGLLRLFTLAAGDEVIAVYYGFQAGDRSYAYLSGFDPAYAFESPGTLVVAHAIAEALAEGVREFHFLRGQEAYKYAWGATDRWNRLCVVRRSAEDHEAA
jgi:CelD/BcsL family acetyltransferase involved in cellulose biosynthesis